MIQVYYTWNFWLILSSDLLYWQNLEMGKQIHHPVTSWQIDGETVETLFWMTLLDDTGNSVRLYFFGAPKSLQIVNAAMKLKDAYSLKGKL